MTAAGLLRAPLSAFRRLRAARRPAVCVVVYHRVAEAEVDPWGLCVSPDRFAAHLDLYGRWGTLLSVDDLVERLAEGRLPRRAVAVTFDDGYPDNLDTAAPLLARHGAPATVFVTTGREGRTREMWWDELERVLLLPGPLPPTLDGPLGGVPVQWDLGDAAAYGAARAGRHRGWRAWEPPPTPRHALYRHLWERLVERPAPAQRAALDDLLTWAGCDPAPRPTHRLLSDDGVRALARTVDVGAHTVTHAALPALPPAAQQDELAASRDRLEAVLGRPVRTCAYPYGRTSAATRAAAAAAGFDAAFTTEPDAVRPGADPLAVPRIAVPDVPAGVLRETLTQAVR